MSDIEEAFKRIIVLEQENKKLWTMFRILDHMGAIPLYPVYNAPEELNKLLFEFHRQEAYTDDK